MQGQIGTAGSVRHMTIIQAKPAQGQAGAGTPQRVGEPLVRLTDIEIGVAVGISGRSR